MLRNRIDIIVVTYNNSKYLNPCVRSIHATGVLNGGFARLIIVNNGQHPVEDDWGWHENIEVINTGKNIGWEAALQKGIDISDAKFIVFQNDDTFIPKACQQFYHNMLQPFINPEVGAVGPTTTCSTGLQSVYHPESPRGISEVSFLIYFCVMLKREALDKAGGIDLSLPSGDDFDLSIRLRENGYVSLLQPDAFIIHHGFVTGEKVRGKPQVKGGWNSQEMIEETTANLIRRHGFKTYLETIRGFAPSVPKHLEDEEGELVKKHVRGQYIVELGCGPRKTFEKSLGIDRVPKGEPIPNLYGEVSVADIVADVSEKLPLGVDSQDTVISRHILEHCIDPVQTVKHWNRVIKPKGRLIIAVPDEQVTHGIPMNPEHCHAFDQNSLRSLVELVGFKQVTSKSVGNGVSFVSCFEKNNGIQK